MVLRVTERRHDPGDAGGSLSVGHNSRLRDLAIRTRRLSDQIEAVEHFGDNVHMRKREMNAVERYEAEQKEEIAAEMKALRDARAKGDLRYPERPAVYGWSVAECQGCGSGPIPVAHIHVDATGDAHRGAWVNLCRQCIADAVTVLDDRARR
jgi:hypothetical protein